MICNSAATIRRCGRFRVAALALGMLGMLFGPPAVLAAGKKIVFIAGTRSHGYGAHEHNAGCLLLARSLKQGMPDYDVVVYQNGWPKEPGALEGADAIVMYCDGGQRHLVLPHLDEVDELARRGVGIVCLHYAVEVPKGKPGEKFLQWIGGYFETYWSVNPHWTANFEKLPDHPITRGVEPFEIEDEWYYHMRFREGMKGVTPILTALPPPETLRRPDGHHSNNPHVRAAVLERKEPQHVAWAAERPGGGRGFGFTGGHFHWNWGDPNFRKLVLNAIVWCAHGEVPLHGVTDRPVTLEDLEANQDYPPPPNFDREAIRRRLHLPSKADQSKSDDKVRPALVSPIITRDTDGLVDLEVELGRSKRLALVVTDGGDGIEGDWAVWAEPRLVGPSGELKLTELQWRTATADRGAVRVNQSAAGGPLRAGGQTIADGIGTHANSVIFYLLPPGYTHFRVRVGLEGGGDPQATRRGGSVQFVVYTTNPPQEAYAAGDINAQRDPGRAVAGLDLAPGLEATLFASEPTLLSLTNLDVDYRGRVWVCEVVNYRRNAGRRPEGDRILILEDTDGDGRADKSKVYYQGTDIDSAMGICVLGNRVIVSCSPNIWVFTDEDGDDVPDRKEALFTNTGQPQHDHSAHSFLFGPDGKLYWNFGNTGGAVHDQDGRPVVDMAGNVVVDNGRPYYGGMVFRCNLDGSQFEVLGHNFRNNYEVTVDSFGTMWQSDNDDDGNRGVRINYVMEYGNYGYRDEMTGASWQVPRTGMHPEIPRRHWHQNDPGVVPNLLQTGAGSPTGITVYEGRLLPEVVWDQIIHCDAGPNVVRAYPVEPDGAGYRASIVNLVHGARDNWFRPADVCVAPDGSLFVTDWYDPGVGGHRMADIDRGRLFRIAPPGKPYRVPQFDFSTPQGAIAALKNPSFSVRYLAWTALHEMGERAVGPLREMAEDKHPRFRARALWVLGKIAGHGSEAVERAIGDPEPDVRVMGVRLAGQLGMNVVPIVERLVNDRSPQVRRQLAIALRHNGSPEMPRLWAELARQHDGRDRWYLEALGIGADKRWDECLAAWLKLVGSEWRGAAGRDIVWRSRAEKTPELLAEIILDPGVGTDELPRYFRALDFFTSKQRAAALDRLASADLPPGKRGRLIAVETAQRLNGIARPEHEQLVRAALQSVRGTEQFVSLVAKFDSLDCNGELLALAQSDPSGQAGVDAMRLLLDRGGEQRVKSALAGDDLAKALATVEALGNSSHGRAVPLLMPIVRDERADLELRRQATRALARSRRGATLLLDLVEHGQLDERLRAAAASSLNAATWDDVRQRAARFFPPPPGRDDKPLPPIAELVKRRGNARRGQEVFRTVGQCANCHTVNGAGKQVGPDLSEIGAKLSRSALWESILYPSAGISHNYETYQAILSSGEVLSGILISQTADSIALKNKEGLVQTVPISQVEELVRSNISLMPEDLQRTLSLEQLADVVEYLTTLRGQSP